jgi:hypothetical protein
VSAAASFAVAGARVDGDRRVVDLCGGGGDAVDYETLGPLASLAVAWPSWQGRPWHTARAAGEFAADRRGVAFALTLAAAATMSLSLSVDGGVGVTVVHRGDGSLCAHVPWSAAPRTTLEPAEFPPGDYVVAAYAAPTPPATGDGGLVAWLWGGAPAAAPRAFRIAVHASEPVVLEATTTTDPAFLDEAERLPLLLRGDVDDHGDVAVRVLASSSAASLLAENRSAERATVTVDCSDSRNARSASGAFAHTADLAPGEASRVVLHLARREASRPWGLSYRVRYSPCY